MNVGSRGPDRPSTAPCGTRQAGQADGDESDGRQERRQRVITGLAHQAQNERTSLPRQGFMNDDDEDEEDDDEGWW